VRGAKLRLLRPLPAGGDLAVLLPPAERAKLRAERQREFAPAGRLCVWQVALLALGLLSASSLALAATGPERLSILATLIKWTPLLAKGFLFNLAISALAMAIGTASGAFVGLGQVSPNAAWRRVCRFATHFFRNAPWLVLLFYCMYLLPFQVKIAGLVIPLPDWIKATFGLALPVMANVSEILRGAVQSIPPGQWESSAALAFNRRQTMWLVILPQCVKRMLPPWMNLYSILTMGTVLTSIVGVNEVMTLTGDALAAENRPELLLPFYSYVLIWFFLYCYPIARWTVRLERKFAVAG
jgi:polar amino acid transport system permease protein